MITLPFNLSFKSAVSIGGAVIIAITIAVMGGTIWVKNNEIDSLNNKITSLNLDVTKLKSSINEQNNAIAKLEQEAKQYNDNMVKANTIIDEKEKETRRLISLIRKAPIPKDCEGALNHLTTSTVEHAKKWNSVN